LKMKGWLKHTEVKLIDFGIVVVSRDEWAEGCSLRVEGCGICRLKGRKAPLRLYLDDSSGVSTQQRGAIGRLTTIYCGVFTMLSKLTHVVDGWDCLITVLGS
jgi:hypothetical protein